MKLFAEIEAHAAKLDSLANALRAGALTADQVCTKIRAMADSMRRNVAAAKREQSKRAAP